MLNDSQVQALPVVRESDFLPPVNRWTRLGGGILALAVVLAIPITSKIDYRVVVRGQASVRPAGELNLIQAAREGNIAQLLVQENQKVKQGEIIAILDSSRLETQKDRLIGDIRQSELQQKQIQAQIKSQNRRLNAEQDRFHQIINSRNAELSRRFREDRDLRITTISQVEEAQAQLRSAQEELKQAKTNLVKTNANLNSILAATKAAKSLRDRYQTIAASGAISQNQLDEAELNLQQQQAEVIARQADIQNQKQEIVRREQQVLAAKARLENVKAALNPDNSEIAIAKANLAQEQASRKANLFSLQQEKESLIQQEIVIQNQIEQYGSELKQVETDLEQSNITATTDGIVFQLNLRNIGQTVLKGDRITQIAPSNSPLEIKTLIPAQEINKIEIGQTVQTRITACPYPDYGTLGGKVTQIAPDTFASESTGNNAFYEVRIEPESLILQRKHRECSIQYGMEGRADIITKKETVLGFLLRKGKLLTDL